MFYIYKTDFLVTIIELLRFLNGYDKLRTDSYNMKASFYKLMK